MNYNYSLIIPHYNIPKLLRRLLSTVPRRDDMQVIVVDDCSTKELDELETVRKDYDWVEWYATGTNGGGGKARNIGLDHAKGKYLIFADADDYFNPNFVSILDEYKMLQYDLVYFNCSSVTDYFLDNNKRGEFITKKLKQIIASEQINRVKYQFTQPWAKLISATLVKNNQILFEESVISNDVKFSTLCDFYAKKIQIDLRAIYCTVERVESTSHKVVSIEKALVRLNIDCWRWSFIRLQNVTNISIYDCIGAPLRILLRSYNKRVDREIIQILKINRISILQLIIIGLKLQIRSIGKRLMLPLREIQK